MGPVSAFDWAAAEVVRSSDATAAGHLVHMPTHLDIQVRNYALTLTLTHLDIQVQDYALTLTLTHLDIHAILCNFF
jgi:hypothetical protein